MPWLCWAFDSCQNSEVNSGAFYRVLPDIVCVLTRYPEMPDFNMGERQQIESKLKKCNILAVYMI